MLLYLGGTKARIKQEKLGSGTDGIVYSTTDGSVIKVHLSESRFHNELRAYLRLQEHGVEQMLGFSVPQLRRHDSKLLIVEISHVNVPFLIDFGKSALDQADFPPEAWAWWRDRVEAVFGSHADVALAVFEELRRRYGVYHFDLNPYNLRFVEHTDDPQADNTDDHKYWR